jgi:predicted dehydrogenase
MPPKVRVGFIGAGRISDLHQLGYRDNPTGELVALADVDAKVAESQARKWGVKKVYTDHRRLLADKEIDAVEILLPHHLHLPVTLEALDAGKHVSLQKPMALNMAEARRMVAAAKKSGRMFRVFENYRTYEPYMRAKQMLDAGEIGNPLSIRVKTVQGKGAGGWEVPQRAMAWRVDAKTGGGAPAILDYGYHVTSIVPFLLGRVEKVHAMADVSAGPDKWPGTPSMVVWKHEGAQKFGSWDLLSSPEFVIPTRYYPVDEWVELTGTRGILWVTRCSSRMVDLPPVVMFRDGNRFDFSDMETEWGDSFRRGAHLFTKAVLGGEQAELDGDEAAHCLAFCLAVMKSALEHREVRLGEL